MHVRRIWSAESGVLTALILGFTGLSLSYAWSSFIFHLNARFRLFDDAFYYFLVAKNIARGYGSTFDQSNLTNGYQPLWLVLLVPIFAIGAAPITTVHLVLSLQSLLGIATLLLQSRLLIRARGSLIAASVAVLWLTDDFISIIVSGLETALLLLTMVTVGVVWVGVRSKPASRTTSLAYGLLLGACVLARVDTGLWVGVLLGLLVIQGQTRRFHLTAVGAGLMLLLVPYAALNFMIFDHILPISGWAKSSFPDVLVFERLANGTWRFLIGPSVLGTAGAGVVWLLGTMLPRRSSVKVGLLLVAAMLLVRVNTLLLVVMLASAVERRDSRASRLPQLVASLVLFAILLIVFELTFMRWGIMWWHFAPITLLIAPWLGIVVGSEIGLTLYHWRPWTSPWVARAILASCVALGWFQGSLAWREYRRGDTGQQPNWQLISYEAAQWVDAHLPSDARLGMSDSGVMGYFSRRQVINLDGLINSFEYQYAVERGQGVTWLASKGMEYLVFHHVPVGKSEGTYIYEVPARKFGRSGGTFHLAACQRVYKSEPYMDLRQMAELVIWKVPRAGETACSWRGAVPRSGLPSP